MFAATGQGAVLLRDCIGRHGTHVRAHVNGLVVPQSPFVTQNKNERSFVNRHDLDFASAGTALPAQTIELNEDVTGELEYPLA